MTAQPFLLNLLLTEHLVTFGHCSGHNLPFPKDCNLTGSLHSHRKSPPKKKFKVM